MEYPSTVPDAYRDTPFLCPACTRPMETRQAGATSVHVCVTCKGLWIDWFDGEASVVAQLAGPLSIPRAPIAAIQRATCPDCRSALTLQPYGPGGRTLALQ